ncbi:3-dehydroquinate synthase, partial [Porcipelethomonas sp.]|uniref:3-dehydroquinate synthase n=1 Tax=Porcipelethomonas sp. TaxID=2981675 RepID=UPI003EFA99B6
MKIITVNASTAYNIYIERGLLKNCGNIISDTVKTRRVAVITDDIVHRLYYNDVEKSLTEHGFTVSEFVFPNGEESKSSDTLNKIYNFLCENSITRSDCIIALGGGVVGDITGFAAATFLRGIDYIQIPTTLLAQIDSSVGGKTAIDLPCGKNLVGAFKQPSCVICDSDVLETLKPEILSDGMAEAIKYGMIRDKELFDLIASHNLGNVHSIIDEIVYKSVSIKKDVVEHDEFDTGERMILNFGHTLGHAVESYYNYKTYTHGSAVAIGMCMISKKGCSEELTEKLINCVHAYKLPDCCDAPAGKLVKLCYNDKKRVSNSINYIICKEIGKASIKKVSVDEFEKFILD